MSDSSSEEEKVSPAYLSDLGSCEMSFGAGLQIVALGVQTSFRPLCSVQGSVVEDRVPGHLVDNRDRHHHLEKSLEVGNSYGTVDWARHALKNFR